MTKEFFELGRKTKNIEVTISYRIIQLFSEGLYSSPTKAIEELVTNSFDAEAKNVHVIIPPDFYAADASIAIIDDGEGMDYNDLTNHWIIGKSIKPGKKKGTSRAQIGKFGIGKLATYVLANRFTHISKKNGMYYSTSMDYHAIPAQNADEGVYANENSKEKVSLPFKELTEAEAKLAVAEWSEGSKKGYKAIKLFGKGSKPSWTVSVMSDLKDDMMANLKIGRLNWILSTALPLRDDFKLYLNGLEIRSNRRGKAESSWLLGKDLLAENLDKPAPVDLTDSEDKKGAQRYGLHEPALGRITGYVELYADSLDNRKSAGNDRNNGFYIYVKDRLINEEDGHFGIGSNELSHGAFSRCRVILHIDRLDEDLRSSREGVRDSIAVGKTKDLLRSIFNFIRREYKKREEAKSPGAKFSSAIAASPYSMTHRPLLGLLRLALDGKYTPRLITYPTGLSGKNKNVYVGQFENRIAANESFIKSAEIAGLDPNDPIAMLDLDTGILKINSFHPFVSHFLSEFENARTNLPLELLAMSEVLLEASLVQLGIENESVQSILTQRDQLLRTLAKSTSKKNAYLVSQELQDAANDQNQLEIEIVAAFNSLGFEAVRIGGKNNPDGVATASLGMSGNSMQKYKVSLEAKSKESKDAKVQNNQVRISTMARHREKNECDHAIVIGQEFPSKGTSLEEEINHDRTNTGKSITAMSIHDLSRLVRLRPLKKIGPKEIRDLFNCKMPADCAAWIDTLEAKKSKAPNYKAILDTIWERQKKRPNETVDYGAIAVALENKKLEYPKDEIKKICKSLEGMAPSYIFCLENDTVELRQKPEIVLEEISTELQKYPDNETKFSFLSK